MLGKDDELNIFDQLDYLFEDDDVHSIGIDYDENDNPVVVVSTGNPEKLQSLKHLDLFSGDIVQQLAVRVVKGEPIEPEMARGSTASSSRIIPETNAHIGMAGTMVRVGGYYGTLSFSANSYSMSTQSQGCSSTSRCIVSNSHVLDSRGKTAKNRNHKTIGTVGCVFDLNGAHPVDAGHAAWTENVIEANRFRVYDSRTGTSFPLAGVVTIRQNAAIEKHGARTGWTNGSVLGRRRIRLRGHRGRFDCWQGSYISAGGDSGSPVVTSSGNQWHLAGIHFASNGHFFGFDVVADGFSINGTPYSI